MPYIDPDTAEMAENAMEGAVSLMMFSATQTIIVATILFLARYIFQNNARVAVMRQQLNTHEHNIKANSEYIEKLNQTIGDLNVTLAVLNEQLKNIKYKKQE